MPRHCASRFPIMMTALLAVIAAMPLPQNSAQAQAPTDYSQSGHWLNVPVNNDQPVDVFYLYPTSWTPQAGDGMICDIDNQSMVAGSNFVFSWQSHAYSPYANVYAPYYRQADAMSLLPLGYDEQDAIMAGAPKADVLAAFDYYIKNFNDGRPFILAGHSQGSNMHLFVLAEYMRANPEVYERMVAAYLIGYSVTDEYLGDNPHLRFAQGENDLGVIVSWNTEAPGLTDRNPVVRPGALVINPLTWGTDEALAPIALNLGSLLLDSNNQPILGADGAPIIGPALADARIDKERGVIVCSTVDKKQYSINMGNVFPEGVFHGMDYPFYFANLQANVLQRSATYLSVGQASMYPAAVQSAVDTTRAFSGQLPTAVQVLSEDVFDARDRADGNTVSDGALASRGVPAEQGFSIFASPFGSWGRQDTRHGRSGYDLDAGGLALGCMRRCGRFYYGLAAGYSRQRMKMTGFSGHMDADVAHTALFAGARFGDWFVEASAGYSHYWNDSERNVTFPGTTNLRFAADFGQDIWSARLEAGRVFELCGDTRLIPGIGVDYAHARGRSLREKGPLSAMRIAGDGYDSLQLPISVHIDKRFRPAPDKTLAPYLKAAWIPELGDRAPGATATFVNAPVAGGFGVKATGRGRTLGRLSGGLKADLNRCVDIGVEYGFEFARSYKNHNLSVNFGVSF